MAVLGLGAGPASAAPPDRHCVSPEGIDLNALHATWHRIVTGFCPVVLAGEHWVPAGGWVTNATHELIPAGYVPAAPTPIEDFNAKFVTAPYVVDAGTRQERAYTFGSGILQKGLSYPGTPLPMTGFLAVLGPLSVGTHTVDLYVTLGADHWDGFGLDPSSDLIPAGVTHWPRTVFEVVPH